MSWQRIMFFAGFMLVVSGVTLFASQPVNDLVGSLVTLTPYNFGPLKFAFENSAGTVLIIGGVSILGYWFHFGYRVDKSEKKKELDEASLGDPGAKHRRQWKTESDVAAALDIFSGGTQAGEVAAFKIVAWGEIGHIIDTATTVKGELESERDGVRFRDNRLNMIAAVCKDLDRVRSSAWLATAVDTEDDCFQKKKEIMDRFHASLSKWKSELKQLNRIYQTKKEREDPKTEKKYNTLYFSVEQEIDSLTAELDRVNGECGLGKIRDLYTEKFREAASSSEAPRSPYDGNN